jgi:hypothetical protein
MALMKGSNQKFNCNKTITNRNIEGQNTVQELIEGIIPERERWRLQAIRIIAGTNGYVTSFGISKKLGKLGFNTRANTVHPFLETLVNAGLCEREALLSKVGYRGVKITEKGLKLNDLLQIPLYIPLQ